MIFYFVPTSFTNLCIQKFLILIPLYNVSLWNDPKLQFSIDYRGTKKGKESLSEPASYKSQSIKKRTTPNNQSQSNCMEQHFPGKKAVKWGF